MKTSEELARKLSRAFIDAEQFITGTVTAIDPIALSCTVQPYNPLMVDVDARMANEDGGFVIMPAIGSTVLLMEADPSDWVVLLYGAVSEVQIKNEAYSWVMDATGITVNDGLNLGIPLVTPLAVRLAAIEGYLNAIQLQYANLLTQLSSTYLPPLAATVASLALPPIAFVPATPADLANPSFKQ